MQSLSKSELNQLWGLVKGHAPGDRAEFLATLNGMIDAGTATVTVTPLRVEVKMPGIAVAFDRN